MVQMKNRVFPAWFDGDRVSYNEAALHKVGYFGETDVYERKYHQAVRPLLNLSRGMIRRPASWSTTW